jgi:PTH1 family peptidyl-tRNA hydrolase
MFLIVGLGNVGNESEGTRHNAGFVVVDELSRRWRIPLRTIKFQSYFGKGAIKRFGKEEHIVLAKPLTYMNLSGRAVKPLKEAFELPGDNIIIIHDDLDLPLGKIRIKRNGGDGGHKGLYSIISMTGPSFIRVRVGIGRPENKDNVVDYVLSKFRKNELPLFEESVIDASDAVEQIIFFGLEKAQNIFNSKKE